MKLPSTRRAVISVTLLLATAALLAAGPAQAQRGGLSITPGILEHAARSGGVGAVEIANTTARPMRVRLAVRPWRQARNGSVTPNRRKVLGKVRPNRGGFRLGAGGTRTVPLRLVRPPKRRSLYGAIEVTGAPLRRGSNNIKVAYRLVTSLRLFPPAGARRFKARLKRLYVKGTARRGALFLAVKNAGNTIDPITAKMTIRSRGRTVANQVTETILPGATVNMRLVRLRGTLPRGRYRLSVRLTQNGRKVGGFRRGIRLP